MRWSCSALGLTTVAILACSGSGLTDDELREFKLLETRLADLVNATAEDRSIRLDELAAAGIQTDRVKQIQGLCVTAYRSLSSSAELFASAKKKTAQVETAVAEAEEAKKGGKELDPALEREILELKSAAEAAVARANRSLDRSEELARLCEARCNAFRALVNQ